MGKRINQQARGKGSLTYRVRKKAFLHTIGYPRGNGEAEITKIFHSAGHSAPLMKLSLGKEIAFMPAFNGASEGQKIHIGGEPKEGNVSYLKDIPVGKQIYNIERNPGDGGKIMRTAGSAAVLSKKMDYGKISVTMPNRKEIILSENCRATLGRIAGDGRLLKPFMKAGPKFHKMKARSKLYPRVSAVAMNAVDHPFGSGRGKRIKSKTAKRNAPPGRRVGHIRPRRTGHKR